MSKPNLEFCEELTNNEGVNLRQLIIQEAEGQNQQKLKSIYFNFHDDNLQEFYEIVELLPGNETKETVMDLCWDWEKAMHNENEQDILECFKDKISDCQLLTWVYNTITDRGCGYKLGKFLNNFIGPKTKTMINFFNLIISTILHYMDLFKDVIMAFILKHISEKILVRLFPLGMKS